MQDTSKQTIAFAGMFQCIELIQQLAWSGKLDVAPFEICLRSLFELQPASYPEVYGGTENLRTGLLALRDSLTNKTNRRGLERTRYALTLIFLEKKLAKQKAMLDIISEGIERASRQLQHFELTHNNVVSSLADTYQNSISKIGPKILVQGDQSYLSNDINASRIRALLLAGVRAAVLWKQAGGNRWRLIMNRSDLLQEVDRLLEQPWSGLK